MKSHPKYVFIRYLLLVKGVCPQRSLKGGKRETPSVVFIYTTVLFCKPMGRMSSLRTATIQLGEGMHACMSLTAERSAVVPHRAERSARSVYIPSWTGN